MLHDLEELEDIKAYDKVMKKKQDFIPLEDALKAVETSRKKKSKK